MQATAVPLTALSLPSRNATRLPVFIPLMRPRIMSSLNRADDDARAGIPMLPIVSGRAETIDQSLVYSVPLVPTSMLPWALGFAGPIYAAAATVCGMVLVHRALQLSKVTGADRRAANRLFTFSVFDLFSQFSALLASNGLNRCSSMGSAHAAPGANASLEAKTLLRKSTSAWGDEG